MWHLSGRDHIIKQYQDYGDFATIADAAACILELEGDPLGPVLFSFIADLLEMRQNPLTIPMPHSSPICIAERRSVFTGWIERCSNSILLHFAARSCPKVFAM